MDKRYQVFVSSTYKDLIEERRHVTQALLEMDCIPAGMEMFPAIDEDQFEFIKTVIDDCDYYLLIIAGRYGSLDAQGVSYTEKEYDYAKAKGIPVIPLLHANPGSIESDKTEQSEEGRTKLAAFRKKAQSNRLSKEWATPDELAGLVSRALHVSFKRFQAVGWIRADKAASEDVLSEINALRKENDKLKQQLAAVNAAPPVPENLASLDDKFKLHGHFTIYGGSYNKTVKRSWERVVTWRELFKRIAPYLVESKEDSSVKKLTADNVAPSKDTTVLNDQDFQTIKLQFQALKLMDVYTSKAVDGKYYIFWSLTPSGKALAFDLRTVKKGETEKAIEPE